jgi:hypothetical protein
LEKEHKKGATPMSRMFYKQWIPKKVPGKWFLRDIEEKVIVPFVEGVVTLARCEGFSVDNVRAPLHAMYLFLTLSTQPRKRFTLITAVRINVGERIRLFCETEDLKEKDLIFPKGFEILGEGDKIIFGPVRLSQFCYFEGDEVTNAEQNKSTNLFF